jgi:hypothetical protein
MKNADIQFWAIAAGIAGLLYFLSKSSTAANADMGGENFGVNDPTNWDGP